MTIFENNKLIADFISLESNDEGYINDHNSMQYIAEFSWDYGRLHLEDLRFHCDWNWLMVVIQKIENPPEYNFFVHILGNGCFIDTANADIHMKNKGWIVSSSDIFSYEEGMHPSKLEAVYRTVVEFIKWYNTQKS